MFLVLCFFVSLLCFGSDEREQVQCGNFLWKGRCVDNLSDEELGERFQELQAIAQGEDAVCKPGSWLYGKEGETVNDIVHGTVVVCGPNAYDNIATELAQKVWCHLQRDFEEGITFDEVLIVGALRAALPVLWKIYEYVKARAQGPKYKGQMPYFHATPQPGRSQDKGTQGLSTEKYRAHRRNQVYTRQYRSMYFVDDLMKTGNTMAGDMVDAAMTFASLKKLRCFVLFGVEVPQDGEFPAPGEKICVPRHAEPAKKFEPFFDYLSKRFDHQFVMEADCVRVINRAEQNIWLMSGAEASMPVFGDEARSRLIWLLDEINKAFSPAYLKSLRCIMVPGLGVFCKDGWKVFSDISLRFSNEAGDWFRYHEHEKLASLDSLEASRRIEALMPEGLSKPGAIRSPLLHITQKGADFIFRRSEDPFLEELNLASKIQNTVVSHHNTLIVLPPVLPKERSMFANDVEGVDLYSGVASRLRDSYGYVVLNLAVKEGVLQEACIPANSIFSVFPKVELSPDSRRLSQVHSSDSSRPSSN